MRILWFRAPALVLWCCLALSLAAGQARAWTQDKFVLGVWNDPWVARPPEKNVALNQKRFRMVRDAHLNLLDGSGAYGYDMSFIDQVLDLCIATNLSTLVRISTPADKLGINFHDRCTFDPTCPEFDRKTYEKTLSYRGHFLPTQLSPARRAHFYGYFLGDEPDPIASHYLPLKDALQRYKEFDPGALVFMNLYGQFTTNRNLYLAYVDSMCNDPNPNRRPDVVSYDDYPFQRTSMVPVYFDNLSIMRRVAGSRPLWCSVLCTGFDDAADPTPVQIRFGTNCPIAYGAKGLMYFTYNQNQPNKIGMRRAMVDNADYPTPTYGIVQNINYYLEQVVGPAVMSSQWLETFHVAQYPPKLVIPSSEIFRAGRSAILAGITGQTMLCGVFQSPSATYLWVVNKDTTSTNATTLSVKGNRSGRVSLGPTEMQYAGDTSYAAWPATYDSDHDVTVLGPIRLAPCEGRLIRIVN